MYMKLMKRSGILVVMLAALLLSGPLSAQENSSFPKVTPELMDKLNANLDTTWPHDPAVPELPAMPVTDDPKHDPDAFLWTHFNDNIYPPKVLGVPERRTRIVTEEDPLEVDVYWYTV